mgnify:CR=1 FL=1
MGYFTGQKQGVDKDFGMEVNQTHWHWFGLPQMSLAAKITLNLQKGDKQAISSQDHFASNADAIYKNGGDFNVPY